MNIIKLLLSLLVLLLSINSASAHVSNSDALSLIPAPNHLTRQEGDFLLTNSTKIVINNEEGLSVAEYFEHFINPATGMSLEIITDKNTKADRTNTIHLLIDSSVEGDEAYSLIASVNNIVIRASTKAGLFYATQSLRQLLPSAIEKRIPINNVTWKIPAVTINDSPRFEYRGMHLDVGRHFYPTKFIKKYIDLIAAHKMNRFHWHLTEDQGWRIEIKKYPKLTQIGGYRKGTVYGHAYDEGGRDDNLQYGGFYSQKEIKDIVAYAKQRNVTIVPEIDLPGHSVAALAAYPELGLGCTQDTFNVRIQWGVSKDIYCPSEETFTFIEDVLNEVMDLFPSEYIHIGGDEAPKDRWKKSKTAQKVMKDNGLKDEHELQSYFIKRVEKMLTKRDRKLIGWDEILEGGLSESATVMFWRSWGEHFNNIKTVLEQGNPVIMTPVSHLYFDYYQSESMDEPKAWGSYLPLKKVYSYDPIIEGISEKQASQIMGAQGNVWTEYIPTARMVEYRSQPRMAAVGELTWSSKKHKNWESFVTRLDGHFSRLDAMDVNAARSVYNVHGELSEDRKILSLETDGGNHQIRYTLDGSVPNYKSPLYQQAFILDKTTHVRAIAENKSTLDHFGDYKLSYINHLAVGKKITFSKKSHKNFHEQGQSILTDGHISYNRHHMRMKNRWVVVQGEDVKAVIDLETAQNISKVSFGIQPSIGVRFKSPQYVVIDVSTDGNSWKTVSEKDTSMASKNGRTSIEFPFDIISARYVRITAIKAHRFDEFIVE